MNGIMCRFYLLKKVCESLSADILNNLDMNDEKLINLADFLSTTMFYKRNLKPNKYHVYEKLTDDKFYEFFTEVLISTSKNVTYDGLLFCYSLICYKLENEILIPYLEEIKDPTTDINEALNMLDYYYAKKYDDIDLRKTNLVLKYPEAFKYQEFLEKLIHNPMIRTIQLFETSNYLKRSYKNKTHFYNYYTKSKLGITKLSLLIYRTMSRNQRAKHSFYKDVMDTKILNMPKNTFKLGDKEFNYTLEELVKYMLKMVNEYVLAINEYLMLKKDKRIRKLLNISSEKKM